MASKLCLELPWESVSPLRVYPWGERRGGQVAVVWLLTPDHAPAEQACYNLFNWLLPILGLLAQQSDRLTAVMGKFRESKKNQDHCCHHPARIKGGPDQRLMAGTTQRGRHRQKHRTPRTHIFGCQGTRAGLRNRAKALRLGNCNKDCFISRKSEKPNPEKDPPC